MGGRPVLGVLASIREELGKGPGDTVMIAIERDDGDRTVTIPDESPPSEPNDPPRKRPRSRGARSDGPRSGGSRGKSRPRSRKR